MSLPAPHDPTEPRPPEPGAGEGTAGAGELVPRPGELVPRPGELVAGPDEPAPGGREPAPAADGGHRSTRLVIEWAVILAVAVAAALLIRSFVIQPFFIPSGSMEPTLQIGDRVLVNKLSYDLHAVHRGDVVVFAKPPGDVSPGIKDLIKRVVGLPGETISTQQGRVYIDGKALAEPWLPKTQVPVPQGPVCPLRTMVIPAGDYFMMGDNRGDSDDSRCFGPVPKHLFVGKAFLRVWPVSRLGTL